MAQISYAGQALADLERISEFLALESPAAALTALDLIDEAVSILARHPLIGRAAESNLRELVISQGRTGFIALYCYEHDAVLVLAIRHQREAGFQTWTE